MKGRWSGRPGSNRRRSAWKADTLPTELHPQTLKLRFYLCFAFKRTIRPYRSKHPVVFRWRVLDSNQRRHRRQIYSLLPLAARATLRIFYFARKRSNFGQLWSTLVSMLTWVCPAYALFVLSAYALLFSTSRSCRCPLCCLRAGFWVDPHREPRWS